MPYANLFALAVQVVLASPASPSAQAASPTSPATPAAASVAPVAPTAAPATPAAASAAPVAPTAAPRPPVPALHAQAAAGGGLAVLDVVVDLARGVVTANGVELPIPIDRAALPGENAVVVETLAIGQGKHVVHVRVPTRDSDGESGPAWEAILAAGHKAPIFAGMTGPTEGDPGERTGKAVRIVPNGDTSFVLVGDTREDLTLCGQSTTLLDPLALYPASLDLRPATVQRLGEDLQAKAEAIPATEKAGGIDAPLAQLLVARGSSVAGSRGAELTDGDPNSLWRERRPGIGQGEFVVMSAPKGVPITRIELTISPPDVPGAVTAGQGAAPRTFYFVTTEAAYEVTLPTDGWTKRGAAYQVTFAHPLETSCLAIVLDAAYSRGLAHPDVGIAEVRAYSEFDTPGATLDGVAKQLSGERRLAAAQLLERAGAGAVAAVSSAYDALDAPGRALAIDVAASHDKCEEAAPLLARGLCEADGEAPRKAREKLERCKGSASALAQRLRDDATSRACLAPVLATLAPEAALEPIADALASTPEDDHDTRAVLRDSFAHALASAPGAQLGTLLGDERRSPAARLDIMRASGGRVTEADAEAEATVTALLAGTPTMRARYLVLGPLGELSRAGDHVAAAHIADAAAHDPDWPVRARAAGLAAGVPEAAAALIAASHDPEPRVREAALGALSASSPESTRAGIDAIAKGGRLRQDEWWFVKSQAIALLANAGASKEVDDALGGALRDPSMRVRGAAILVLAKRHAAAWRGPIGERLDDSSEEPAVRAASARALGVICDNDGDTIERLTAYARGLANAEADEDAQLIGFGALQGLAALQPRDLRDRLQPLLVPAAPPAVRIAAQQALTMHSMCR